MEHFRIPDISSPFGTLWKIQVSSFYMNQNVKCATISSLTVSTFGSNLVSSTAGLLFPFGYQNGFKDFFGFKDNVYVNSTHTEWGPLLPSFSFTKKSTITMPNCKTLANLLLGEK